MVLLFPRTRPPPGLRGLRTPGMQRSLLSCGPLAAAAPLLLTSVPRSPRLQQGQTQCLSLVQTSLSPPRATLLEKAGDIPRSLIALSALPTSCLPPAAHPQGSGDFLLPDAVGTLLMVLELSASLAPPPLCPWDCHWLHRASVLLLSFWPPLLFCVAAPPLGRGPFSLALSFQPCSCSEGCACAALCHLSRELRRHLPGLRPALPERPRAALKQQVPSVRHPVPSRTSQGLPRL